VAKRFPDGFCAPDGRAGLGVLGLPHWRLGVEALQRAHLLKQARLLRRVRLLQRVHLLRRVHHSDECSLATKGSFNWMTWSDHYLPDQLTEAASQYGIKVTPTLFSDNSRPF